MPSITITTSQAAAMGHTLAGPLVIDSKKELKTEKLENIVRIAAQYLVYSSEDLNRNDSNIDRLRLRGVSIRNSSGILLGGETIPGGMVLDRFYSLLRKEKREKVADLWQDSAAMKEQFSLTFVSYIANSLGKLSKEWRSYPPNSKEPTNIFDNIVKDIEFFKEKCGFDINTNTSAILTNALEQQLQQYDFIYIIKKLIAIGSQLSSDQCFSWLKVSIISGDTDILVELLQLDGKLFDGKLSDNNKIELLEIALKKDNYRAFEKIVGCGLKNYRHSMVEGLVYNAEKKNPIYLEACMKAWDIKSNRNLLVKLLKHNICIEQIIAWRERSSSPASEAAAPEIASESPGETGRKSGASTEGVLAEIAHSPDTPINASGINFLEPFDNNYPLLFCATSLETFSKILSQYTPEEACQALLNKTVLNIVQESNFRSAYLDYCFSKIDQKMGRNILFFVLEHAPQKEFRLGLIARLYESGVNFSQPDQEDRFPLLLAKSEDEISLFLSLCGPEVIKGLFANKQFFQQWRAISIPFKWVYVFHMLGNGYELKIDKNSLIPEDYSQSPFLSSMDPRKISLLFPYYPFGRSRELFSSPAFLDRWFTLPASVQHLQLQEGGKYGIRISKEMAEKILKEKEDLTPPYIDFLLSLGVDPLKINEQKNCFLFTIKQSTTFYLLYERYLSRLKELFLGELPPNSLYDMPVAHQCSYFEIAFPEDRFAYVEWVHPLINRNLGSEISLDHLFNCIYSKEVFVYLISKDAAFGNFVSNNSYSVASSTRWESLSLLEKFLFIRFAPITFLKDFSSTEEFFTKKIIDKAIDAENPTTLAELIQQYNNGGGLKKAEAADEIQYLMALHFLPPSKAALLAPGKHLPYLCIAPEENVVLFLQILQKKLLQEKYLSWKGELFDEKMKELDDAKDARKEEKEELWERWSKESSKLNFRLCESLNWEKFTRHLKASLMASETEGSSTADGRMLKVITILQEELKEIERNLDAYRKKIALLNSDATSNDSSLEKIALSDGDSISDNLCPISRDLIKEAVFDGRNFYEKEEIYKSLRYRVGYNPLSRQELTMDQLYEVPKNAFATWKRIKAINNSLSVLRKKLNGENQGVEGNGAPTSDPIKDYEKLFEEKMALLHQLGSIKATIVRTHLPAALRLYCCTSKDAVHSIITEGIRLDLPSHFGEREFEAGLYLSTQGPEYLSDAFPCVIIFEVHQQIEGCLIEPLTQLKRHLGEKITEEYLEIKKSYPFLQHAGPPPAEREIILRHPSDRIKIVGIAKENQSCRYNTPIDGYCKENGLTLHSQWQPKAT